MKKKEKLRVSKQFDGKCELVYEERGILFLLFVSQQQPRAIFPHFNIK